jgi:hypothetical protein
MASNTINFDASASSGKYIDAKIVWASTANNDANTSDVTAELYVRKGDTTQILTIPTSGGWPYKLTVNGSSASGTVTLSVLEDWVLVAKKTVKGISHDSNGIKSITISGSVTAPSVTSFAGHTSSGSGTATFDTIPRATTLDSLSCSTAYFDGTLTYKYTPQSANFYNRCNITLNLNGTYISVRSINLGKKSTTQQTATVTLSATELQEIYKKLPSTTKGVLRFTFRTYSDSGYSSQVGSAIYKEITLTIPTSVKPTASLSLAASNSNSWIASLGAYVQNQSGVTATLSGTAGSGASIASRSISGGGYSSGTDILKISKIATSGDITITGKITDSRGRSTEVSKTITVLPYTVPAVTQLEITRGVYNNGWTAKEDGKDIKITFKTTIALSDQGNAYGPIYKLDGAEVSPDVGAPGGFKSGVSNSVYILDLDGESSHSLTFTAKDFISNGSPVSVTIPTINVTIEFNDSGKGIAFGKTSEKDAFECAFPAEFSGGVKLIRDDGTVIAIGDTGWIDLGISDEVTTTSSATAGHYNGCAYRVVNGNHVYVAFNVRATFSGSAVIVSGTAIPSQYRPKLQPYAVVTLNGSRVARILVSRSTGHAAIDWIRNVADDAEPEEHIATWIDGYIDYWI